MAMSRKVFISFLGVSDYTECVYTYGSYRSRIVMFVQSALTEMVCADWTKDDKILVFLTNEAEEKNWPKLKQEWRIDTSITQGVPISLGKDEAEIWRIFQIIYDSLEESDKLFVDITHSFRSLPLLASSLLQYAKFLKNITVHGIYYGAFETLGNPRDIQVRTPNPNERIVPVFDLTAFSEIQDWSIAANDFIRFGNTTRLSQLTKADINPILRETKGKHKVAASLWNLNNCIDELSMNIRTNRGKELIKGKAPAKIITILNSLEQDLIKPLNPILAELKHSINDIYAGENETKNMLLAVNWCIEKQLIQEGFTILQEGIISFLLDDYHNKDKREFVSGFLNTFAFGVFDKTRYNKLNYQMCADLEDDLKRIPNIGKWSVVFQKITDYRNDINHAGMKSQTSSANYFEVALKELYHQTKLLLPC